MLNLRSIFLVLVFQLVTVTSLGLERPVDELEKDVSHICDTISCPYNKVCRVYRHCNRPKCHPEFVCLNCVPDGADKECNTLGYMFTVLHGDPTRSLALNGLDCHANKACPYGSTCVYHPILVTQGMCCYGGPSPNPPVTNAQKKCRVCVPECKYGYRCEQITDECEKQYNECRPVAKHGRCPGPNSSVFYRLKFGPQRSQCEHDQKCNGVRKCCQSVWGGKYCVRPLRE